MAKFLSKEHEAFCAYLLGGDSQAKAYRKAFSIVSSKDTMQKERNAASKLAKEPEIQKRLLEMRQEQIDFLWTRQKAVEALLSIIEEGNATATLNAVKQLNAMYGYSDIKAIESKDSNDEAINMIEVAIVSSEKMKE